MEPGEFESALRELGTLMANAPADESACQDWFEKHPIALQTYGYRKVIPHPKLTVDGDVMYIPDFLVQRTDGIWEIFELKTPDTELLHNVPRRATFYASLEQYYSQCIEYSAYFDDRNNRVAFEAQYGVSVQKGVASILVAGRSDGLDRSKVHQILHSRGCRVVLQTYDDVRERLEFARTTLYGQFENLSGLSIHLMFRPHADAGDEICVLDIGQNAEESRISIFLERVMHFQANSPVEPA